MKEVATVAGVAVSSVSRVVNRHPDVSQEMRDRVDAAIAELGYQPDILAQSLRRGSTRTVGFIVRDISNPLFADMVRGAETALRDAGYSLVVTNSDGDSSLDAAHINLLNRRRVDGLILSLESETHPPTLDALSGLDSSLVLVDRAISGIQAGSVLSDHYPAVLDAVLDMLRGPANRVGFLGGSLDVRATRERLRGYEDAHRNLGRPIEQELVRCESYQEEFAYEQTRDLLAAGDISGILAGGAQLAVGALRATHDAGVKIGSELDLVAVDGSELMKLLDPPVNTVERDAVSLGHEAARMLVSMLEMGEEPRTILMPTTYQRRGSVRVWADSPA